MTTTTDTIHLRALIRTAQTEQEIQPLIREWLRNLHHGPLTASTVPLWYNMEFDSLIRYEWYLSHRMILVYNEQGTISLFVKE